MSQEQSQNAPTNADYRQPVSFADVSLDSLRTSFNDTYKVSKGSASQLVLGFQSMRSRLQEPTNEYQQTLYPKLKDLCDRLATKYSEIFLTTFGSDVERQVFGANLNGNRNNGSLYRSIPSGVNRNLTYNYAQFGQLMRVLTNRLRFVVQRDPSSVQRYKDSTDELAAYQKLQNTVNTFMTFLGDLSNEWNQLVTETRTRFAVSEQSGQSGQQTQQHQPRQSRQSRYQNGQPRQRESSQSQTTHPRQRYSTQQTQQTQQTSQTSQTSQMSQTSQTQRTRHPQTTRRQTPSQNSGEGWTQTRRRIGGSQSNTQNRVVV
jgi:hypothetical protein